MRRPRRRTTRVNILVTAGCGLAISLALSGCSSGSEDGTDRVGGGRRADGPAVVAPGRPGERAKTLTADEARKARADDSPNSADFGYVQMMIPHHRQALVMTGLARRYAHDVRVRRLAERIAAGQGPEIGAMEGWLDGFGGPRTEHGHHHGEMPGMATDAQLGQLRAARGEKFDALFLTLMITHHRGAVSMATDLLSAGRNTLAEEMANDVIAQQTAEIGRMRRMQRA
ncbi:DUF305 domain-containing protein [Streptomyces angustmyceticus]|uniref:DUF305 domain-containing protein n=1 Tax=Streptomyces angustmyceticus TaxID=285578 RepID=UPI003D935E23